MTTCLGVTMVRRDSYNAQQAVVTLPILKFMNKTNWRIVHQHYEENCWATIFKMIVSADIEKLQIQRTNNCTVLKNIEHIDFSLLLQLNLQLNNIKNIQPLSRINAPNLQKLRLSHNLIVSARPLAKLRCKYLDQLMIQGNFIQQFDFFCQTNFNRKFKTLSLQTWNQKKCQVQSLKCLVKSRLTYLLELNCESERRMKQIRMKAALKSKLQKIEFKMTQQ